ncbi:MAG: hypothetical protein NPIRA02_01910 [Nitrospirales bacterium]|nr:MAG: hypothetical protein NPIRA02_01910 [Nitrospirales bacterium]
MLLNRIFPHYTWDHWNLPRSRVVPSTEATEYFEPRTAKEQKRDRVCGSWIDKNGACVTSPFEREAYDFCIRTWKEKFDQVREYYMKRFEGHHKERRIEERK